MEERNDIPQESGAGPAEAEAPESNTTRSQRWEAQKQKEREELEAKYKDAPFLIKLFELDFGKPLVILSVLVALGVLVFAATNLTRAYHERQADQTNSEEGFSLADFLTFCKDEYPADHNILILWNHGGGPFGYGNDSIYNGQFTLADIRQALDSVYDPDSADKAFDIIGFDACLMSTLEVTHALDGFADYYALSEELEPGDGWDYTPWLRAMTDNPAMSPAAVARAIADSYTDSYMVKNVNLQNIGIPYSFNVTFSVIDAAKAHELYTAYSDLAKAQLKDAVTDISVLSEIGRCGIRATRYSTDASDVFGTVDLGGYVDYMSDYYPDECSRVKKLLAESVLYSRQNGGLSDSQGIAANSDQTADGEEITFSEKSGITREALQDGYYIMSARITDQRGDTYYAPVVGATVTGGKVVEWKPDPSFYGNPY